MRRRSVRESRASTVLLEDIFLLFAPFFPFREVLLLAAFFLGR